MKITALTAAFCGLMIMTTAGEAAVVTRTYDITSSLFTFIAGPSPLVPAPYDPVEIKFTATFDNSSSFGPTSSGLTVDFNTLPFTAQIAYNATNDDLVIATAPIDGNSFYDTPNSFGSFIGDASGAAYSGGTVYTVADGTIYGSNISGVIASPLVSAVPLPASAPLFGAGLLGLAGLGYAAKRRKAAEA